MFVSVMLLSRLSVVIWLELLCLRFVFDECVSVLVLLLNVVVWVMN